MKPYLSIVISAYNESKRIGRTLDAIKDYMSRRSYTYEVIVVDDGSVDTTARVVDERMRAMPALSLLSFGENQGKGAATKAGMLAASGELRLFMDADGSTGIEELRKLLPYTQQGYDVVVGSRRVEGALIKEKQTVIREILGWVYRALAGAVVSTNVQDTQNGFKLFSAEAANAASEPGSKSASSLSESTTCRCSCARAPDIQAVAPTRIMTKSRRLSRSPHRLWKWVRAKRDLITSRTGRGV
jgi:dolichyl-phosphate beta-glucosyltransferase